MASTVTSWSEHRLRSRLHHGVPGGHGLDGRIPPGRRPVSWADPRRLGRFADLAENPCHWGGLGNEGDNAPAGAAAGADRREGVEQSASSVPSRDRGGFPTSCPEGKTNRMRRSADLPGADAGEASAADRLSSDTARGPPHQGSVSSPTKVETGYGQYRYPDDRTSCRLEQGPTHPTETT